MHEPADVPPASATGADEPEPPSNIAAERGASASSHDVDEPTSVATHERSPSRDVDAPASAVAADDPAHTIVDEPADVLRDVLPRPETDAAEVLSAALAYSRFAAETFQEVHDVTVDRYVIRRELGRGGMGVVYAAHDPLLCLPVALKLLPANTPQREAQALARVAGEHVVRVYSAGQFRGQPWIAMQLVDGPNLGEWLRYRRARGALDWREVLARYVEAGRGLGSIHAAGLIHRDFKPQNAVVGADGCVKVLDFGLATELRPAVPQAELMLGTRRYASPEQFLGGPLDPRSDQFSFCVALYEALCAAPPFGEDATGDRLASDPRARAPRPPIELPTWLVSALLRGLARAPGDRHPSMAALLHELTRDRRRGLRLAAQLGATFLAGGLMFAAWSRSDDADAQCRRASDELAAEVERVGSEQLSNVFAAHDRRWRAALATACDERELLGRDLLAARLACLQRGRETLRAVLRRGGSQIDRTRAAIVELPAPESCLAIARTPQLVDPSEPVERELAGAEAARLFGDYEAAVYHARRAHTGAQQAGDTPATARAALALGELERLRGDLIAADAALGEASGLASLIVDHPLHVRVLHERARLDLLERRDESAGRRDLHEADALLRAATTRDDPLWAEHADLRGLLAYTALDLGAAITAHSEAIDRWLRMDPRPDVQRHLATALLHRARAHSARGDASLAMVDVHEALRREVALYGPDHPALADIHYDLARDHLHRGDPASALTSATRALELDQRHHGVDSHRAAGDLQLLAEIDRRRGALALADSTAQRAARSYAADPDTSVSERADIAYLLATLAVDRNAADADELLQRALGELHGTPGDPAGCDRAALQIVRGMHAAASSQLPRAEESLAAAEQSLAALAPDAECEAHEQLPWLRGRVQRKRGQLDAAIVSLAQAHEEPALQLELAESLCARDCSDPRVTELLLAARPGLHRQGLRAELAAATRLLARAR